MSEEKNYDKMSKEQLHEELLLFEVKEREMELKNSEDRYAQQKKYDEQEMIRRSIEVCVNVMSSNCMVIEREKHKCQKEAADKISELVKRLG